MTKQEISKASFKLFQKCWASFPGDKSGAWATPFDFSDWLEWAEEYGLLTVDEEGQYQLTTEVSETVNS